MTKGKVTKSLRKRYTEMVQGDGDLDDRRKQLDEGHRRPIVYPRDADGRIVHVK